MLFVSHSCQLAGAERSLIELVREAQRRTHEVQVFVPRKGPLQDTLWNLLGVRATVVPMHWWMSGRGRGLVGLVRLGQCLLELPIVAFSIWRARPDVVVVNTSMTPAAMLAASLSPASTLILVRESLLTNPSLASILSKRTILSLMHRWADQIVAVSSYVAGQCGTDLVIHSGVRGFATTKVTGPKGVLRAVFLGSLTPDKCPGEAVESVRLAREAGVDVRLRIYGGGTRQEVEQLHRDIFASQTGGHITYQGKVNGPGTAFQDADVLLMTSRNEAFGRVSVEALIAGVPVVGYDTGGTREILARGGGALVAPEPSAMAEVLVSLCRDPDWLSAIAEEADESGKLWIEKQSEKQMIDAVEAVAHAKSFR